MGLLLKIKGQHGSISSPASSKSRLTKFGEDSPFRGMSIVGGSVVVAGVGDAVTFLGESRTSSRNWRAFKMPTVLLKMF